MASRTAALTKVENLFGQVLDNEKVDDEDEESRWCRVVCQPPALSGIMTLIISGARGGIRTPDLMFRRHSL
jgi:hypothetical protein